MQTGGYQIIGLREAITQITRSVKRRERGERYPYFFIVGAGVSLPAMPTTKGIIEDCKRASRTTQSVAAMELSEAYAYWLKDAHFEPIDRQKYFASLVRKAKVNAASLFLAHLLVGSDIARIVVTTNFDDLIRRALRLFGASPRILDYPDSVSRMDLQSEEIQIAHVHGSHHYYDLKNLEIEIESLTDPEPDGPAQIVLQLENLIELSSPIVVGYGGWPKDVVMTALRRVLRKGRLRRNLYWFLYDKHELPSLPDWLRRNGQVYFVVADSPRATPAAPSVSSVSETDAPGGTLSTEPVLEYLDAGRALHELVIALELKAPRIVDDPFGHFAKQIETMIGTDIDQYENYRFRDVVKRMRYAEALEKRFPQRDDPLVRISKLARQGNVAELVDQIELIDYRDDRIASAQYEEMLTALEVGLDTVQLEPNLKLRGLSLLLKMILAYPVKSATPQEKEVGMTPRLQIRRAVKAAKGIEELERFEAAVAAYRSIIEAFGQMTSRRALAYVVEAHELLALVLSRRLQRHDEAVSLLEAFLGGGVRFEGYELRLAILTLRFAYSEVLMRAGRDPLSELERVIAECSESITRSDDNGSDVSFVTKSVRAVAEALIRKGVYLWSREPPDDSGAIHAYEAVIQYAADRPHIARHAARAYRDLAFIHSARRNPSEVVRIATEGIAYLDTTKTLRPAHEVLYRVQLTYLKANALASLGDVGAAIPLYSEIANQATVAGMPGEEYGSSVARIVEHAVNADDSAAAKQHLPALGAALKQAGDKAPEWWRDVFLRTEAYLLSSAV